MKYSIQFSLFILLSTISVSAEEYDFDISEFEKKTVEFSGTAEFRSSLIIPDKNSLSWDLKYFNQNDSPEALDNYLLLVSPYLKYNKNGFFALASANGRVEFNNPDDKWLRDAALLEGYIKFEFNPRWNILLGKKVYKWGKGYIYNPVSYVGRQKDVNDVDALLEGYYTTSMRYTKSFSSTVLKSFSQEIVFLPVYKKLNDDYGDDELNRLFSHTYLMLFNTDYDLYASLTENIDYCIGFAAAHNLLTNWEIHGEISYLQESTKILISDNNQFITQVENDIIQSVVGTRYLASFNSTFYLEYIYNGAGLTESEIDRWYSAVLNSLDSENPQSVKSIRNPWFAIMNRQFVMRHYVYFKIQHPEPFDFLYFTPSVYLLFNIVDQSFLSGIDMNYKRFDSISFNLKMVRLNGCYNSEFGSKISEVKIEFIAKYYL